MAIESCKICTDSFLIGQLSGIKIHSNERAKSLIFAKFLFSTASQPSKVNISIDQIQSTAVPAVRLNAF